MKKDNYYNERSSKILLIMCWVLLSAFGFYLIFNLYKVTIKEYDEHAKAAGETQWKLVTYDARRGLILDSNGEAIAENTYDYTIVITPKDVVSKPDKKEDKVTRAQIIDEFEAVLGMDRQKLEESIPVDPENMDDPLVKLGGMDLCRNVTDEQKKELEKYIKAHKIGGITFVSVPQRYYKDKSFASQVIGYAKNTGDGLNGIIGLEAYYNDILSGTKGYRYSEVDARTDGNLPYSQEVLTEAENGKNIVLNIDNGIQKIAEEACREAYEVYKPKDGVCCIVMNPNTGAILAMVSLPDFDLTDPYGQPYGMDTYQWNTMDEDERIEYLNGKVWRNRCISDTYEPGSTFKALTMCMAFEENLTDESEPFSDAPIKVSDVDTISCWAQKKGWNHGTETLGEAFEQSCNPIFVQLAERIANSDARGVDKYYDYVHTFGFYERTGIDLPAEGVGIFHQDPTRIDMDCLSFGESATVTPIQLLNAYCAIINGGNLMEPHIVKYITDSDGNIVDEIEPKVIRTIFSSETCSRVRALMANVVDVGTGTAGRVVGYSVGGKTSTSTIEVGEDAGKHVLSFSCFAPTDNPQVAVLVVLNKPEDNSVGSSATAKIAGEVLEGALTHLGVPRSFDPKDYDFLTTKYWVETAQEPIIGGTAANAHFQLSKNEITAVNGDAKMTGDTIVGFTYPSAYNSQLYRKGVVILYPEGTPDDKMLKTKVPDLTGKNALECIETLKDSYLNCKFKLPDAGTEGADDYAGVCVAQDHAASSETLAGEIIEVTLVKEDAPTATPTPSPEDDQASEDGVVATAPTDETQESTEGEEQQTEG